MYIEGFGKAVESEIETRMDDATKYNGRIFELTVDENNRYGVMETLLNTLMRKSRL